MKSTTKTRRMTRTWSKKALKAGPRLLSGQRTGTYGPSNPCGHENHQSQQCHLQSEVNRSSSLRENLRRLRRRRPRRAGLTLSIIPFLIHSDHSLTSATFVAGGGSGGSATYATYPTVCLHVDDGLLLVIYRTNVSRISSGRLMECSRSRPGRPYLPKNQFNSWAWTRIQMVFTTT